MTQANTKANAKSVRESKRSKGKAKAKETVTPISGMANLGDAEQVKAIDEAIEAGGVDRHLEEGATVGDSLSTEEIAELKTLPSYEGSEAQTAEAEKESAVDRVIRLREEAEAAKNAPAVVPPAEEKPAEEKPAAKPAAPAKPKSSRFATTIIALTKPDAASPAWKGKRGEAFGVIENFYTKNPNGNLTVGDWLATVSATPTLTKVGFEFLRFYESEGLISLTVVDPPAPVVTEAKAEG